MSYQPVIGFEVHIELDTKSKMFCGCPADHFGKPANSQTCPVCLGLPGALPVPNAKAIQWCIKLGLALNCKISLSSKFDRKNYFYPDLPKGYQISQYDQPFCHSGWVELNSGKKIRITRVHMEEDTGKLQHDKLHGKPVTLVDFNRSGVPLVEIVTEPDFGELDEVTEFLKEIQQIVRVLEISTADMEKGSMRLEANISVKNYQQQQLPNYKIEVKNVNSFRFIKKAIEFEIKRQSHLLKQGQTPRQETRGFNEKTGETFAQRSKEEAHDYRYFPEPDIPPFKFTQSQIDAWRKEIPVLPRDIRQTLTNKYGVKTEYAQIMSSNINMYNIFLQTVDKEPNKGEIIADYLVNKRYDGDLPKSASQIIAALQPKGLTSPQEVKSIVTQVINVNPKAVADYRSGKNQAIYFLIGQCKKQLPAATSEQLKQELEKHLKNSSN